MKVRRGPGGGGVLGLEKGTDCGPTAAELWLSRPKMANKRGAVLLLYLIKGGLSECLVKYDTCNTENLPLNADFKGLFLSIHEKRGL